MGRFVRGSLVARYHRTFGRLVIFDRFVYDTRVNWERTTGVGPRLRMWLLHRASLRPDFVVLIDVPGQTMFDRKGEHDVELLEKRRWRYLELAEGLPGVIVVDGTLPPDQVRRTVTAELWARYAARTQKGHPRIG
jgi:thymidylate kinase